MKIISVVGARPNFMKIAPFISAVNKFNSDLSGRLAIGGIRHEAYIEHLLVHTGQHYDDRMSDQFFKDLDIPEADINLGIGSGTHAEQVGKTMIEFERVLKIEKPDWVVVVGDVNATLACSVTAKKENIKCCHIEAGLRSGDMSMPEEINRLVTDRLSDLLLIPDRLSGENLRKEGVPDKNVKFTGNIMIDTLEINREKASALFPEEILERNLLYKDQFLPKLKDDHFILMTLHRPSNVDNREALTSLIRFFTTEVSKEMPLIWPIHPRTLKQLKLFGLLSEVRASGNFVLLHPLSYHDMLRMNMGAKVLLTDSGGLQEECTILGTPCLALRNNTERPVTLQENGGASVLVGNNIDRIRTEFISALNKSRIPVRPELWDGHSAERCLEAILGFGK